MAWRKIYHANTKQKKEGVSMLISDKAKGRTKNIISGTVGDTDYIMITGSINNSVFVSCGFLTNH